MSKFMQKIFTSLLIMLLFIVLLSELIHAQTGVSLSWYLIKDDNAFKSRNQYNELINTASLQISRTYSAKSFAVQALYGADVSAFSEYSDQQNHAHQISILGRILSGNFMTNFGLYAQMRRNNAQYIYYNTNSYSFYIRGQYNPDLNKIYYFGLNIGKNEFTEFTDLNNIAYRIYGKFQRFYESRTSISGEIGLGVKNYINQSVFQNFGSRGGFFNTDRNTEQSVDAVQLSGYVSIGKSITDKTGVNMKLGGRRYVGDPIESFLDGIYYYTESDLYDDPYSYENQFASLTLTRQFGLGFQGKIGALFNDKDYSGTPALSEVGDLTGENRADIRQEYSLLVSKSFILEWRARFSFNVYFKFLTRLNESNDPYYDFNDHLGILGFSLSK